MKKLNIIIPSKGRAGRAKTIEALRMEGVDFCIIVEPQDYVEYVKAYPEVEIIELPKNDQGISYARNYCVRWARNRKLDYLWMLDDDLNFVGEVEDGKVIKKPYKVVLAQAQALLSQYQNLVVGGLEYQQYAWSSKKDIAFNSYCDTCVMLNLEHMDSFQYRDGVKEDRDMVLQTLSMGYVSARTSLLCFSNPKNGSNKGGLHDQYASGAEAKWSAKMMELWPGVCTPSPKTDRVDVKVNWRLFKDNQPIRRAR